MERPIPSTPLRGDPTVRKTEISWWQFFMLLITVPLSSLITFSPILATFDHLSRDAWISVILAGIVTSGMSFLIYLYARRFQGINLYESIRIVFGRYLGFVINVAVSMSFIFWTAATLKQFAYFFSGTIYTLTPVYVFAILLGLVSILAAAEGIEYIGRLGEVSGTFLIGGLLFYIVMTIPLAEFQFIRPVLANGWTPVVKHGYVALAVIGQTLWVSTLAMPHVNKLESSLKALLFAIATNLIFFIMSIILLIGLFDVELLSVLTFPTLSATRLISVSRIFERLEWLAIIMWIGAMGVKVSLLLHGATIAASTYVTNINRTRSAIVFGCISIIVSLFVFSTKHSVFTFLKSSTYTWASISLQTIGILVLIVAAVRGIRINDLQQEDRV